MSAPSPAFLPTSGASEGPRVQGGQHQDSSQRPPGRIQAQNVTQICDGNMLSSFHTQLPGPDPICHLHHSASPFPPCKPPFHSLLALLTQGRQVQGENHASITYVVKSPLGWVGAGNQTIPGKEE